MVDVLRRSLIAGCALVAASFACAAIADSMPEQVRRISPVAAPKMADRVVVRKSQRRLYLMRGDEVLRDYRISLGLNPVGHKERSGDFRTPEGRYWLTRRNTRSDFFLSIQVSYPNQEDQRHARRNRWDPGGSIMIHGLPNSPRHASEHYATRDWTDGCIAVSNADMVEIWLMTGNNVPIDIQP